MLLLTAQVQLEEGKIVRVADHRRQVRRPSTPTSPTAGSPSGCCAGRRQGRRRRGGRLRTYLKLAPTDRYAREPTLRRRRLRRGAG